MLMARDIKARKKKQDIKKQEPGVYNS